MTALSDNIHNQTIGSVDDRIAELRIYIKEKKMDGRLGFRCEFNATQIDFLTQELNTYNSQSGARLERKILSYTPLKDTDVIGLLENIIYKNNISEWDNTAELLDGLSNRQDIMNEIDTIERRVDHDHKRLYKNPRRTQETRAIRNNTKDISIISFMAVAATISALTPQGTESAIISLSAGILCGATIGVRRTKKALRLEREAIAKPILREKFKEELRLKREHSERIINPCIQKFPIDLKSFKLG